MDRRTVWNGNEHVQLVDLSKGDVVGFASIAPAACPVPIGPPIWHILTVAPNGEGTTQGRLFENGIRAYVPKVYKYMPTKELMPNGQKKMERVARPMFPGYIFADMRPGLHDFRIPLDTKGVRDFLRRDGAPCILPSAMFELIAAREAEGEAGTRKKPLPPFKVGQQVRIKEGPFRDFFATVESVDARWVGVLMDIFARETPARLEAYQLEKV